MEDQTNLYTNAMFEERGLPRAIKEQLAIVVSGLNVSSYCLPAHLEILGRLGMDKAIGRKLALNYSSAPVEPKVMELFRFADKLTRSPGEMQQTDVERLREAGWSDAAIFDAVLVTSLYACANLVFRRSRPHRRLLAAGHDLLKTPSAGNLNTALCKHRTDGATGHIEK